MDETTIIIATVVPCLVSVIGACVVIIKNLGKKISNGNGSNHKESIEDLKASVHKIQVHCAGTVSAFTTKIDSVESDVSEIKSDVKKLLVRDA